MAFQLAYGEQTVLVTALTIAIQKFESRLADPRMESLRAETEFQLSVSRHMLDRLVNPPAPSTRTERRINGARVLEQRLGKALGL
jgi:hypothetical protein